MRVPFAARGREILKSMIRHGAYWQAPSPGQIGRVLAPARGVDTLPEQRLAVAGARPRIRSTGKLSGAIFPPVGKLGADGRKLGLGVDETVAVHDRKLVLMTHGDGINWADLRAEATKQAATGAKDELSQLAVSLLGRDHMHLQAGGWADAGAEAASHAERLTRVRVGP